MHINAFGKVFFDRCLQLDAVSIMDPEQITLKDLRFFCSFEYLLLLVNKRIFFI